jgi:hypothetical protein
VLLIHPTLQATAIGLALIALMLGVQRFRSLHLDQKVRFPRKGHMLVGKFAIAGLLVGACLGMAMTRHAWGQSFMTMGHGVGGVVTLAVLAIGGATGWMLDRKPKKRVWLPAFHGLTNTLGVALALNQVRTGIAVYQTFVSGL